MNPGNEGAESQEVRVPGSGTHSSTEPRFHRSLGWCCGLFVLPAPGSSWGEQSQLLLHACGRQGKSKQRCPALCSNSSGKDSVPRKVGKWTDSESQIDSATYWLWGLWLQATLWNRAIRSAYLDQLGAFLEFLKIKKSVVNCEANQCK